MESKRKDLAKRMSEYKTEKVTITLTSLIVEAVDELTTELNMKSRSAMINLIIKDWITDGMNELDDYIKNKLDKEIKKN